jgi:hypothetical protein
MRSSAHFFAAFILLLLAYSETEAAQPKLYVWVPLGYYSYDGFSIENNKVPAKTQVSGQWALGGLGAHYQLAKKLIVIGDFYGFISYEGKNDNIYRTGAWNIVLKYLPDFNFTKVTVFSKVIHGYVQLGIWSARAHEGSKPTKENEKGFLYGRYSGRGGVIGGGVYCNITSWMYMDLGYKWLLTTPDLISSEVTSTSLCSLGIGLRLW